MKYIIHRASSDTFAQTGEVYTMSGLAKLADKLDVSQVLLHFDYYDPPLDENFDVEILAVDDYVDIG